MSGQKKHEDDSTTLSTPTKNIESNNGNNSDNSKQLTLN